ncbi:MAG: serine/threonine-protein kinase, partial [Gemmataceae bacterium]|nr:serine/threonine-protein kinase [Gemmataceae bacterium]
MLQRLTCSCGHSWQPPDLGEAPTVYQSVTCPACGATVAITPPSIPRMEPQPSVGATGTNRPSDPDATNYDAQAAPADLYATRGTPETADPYATGYAPTGEPTGERFRRPLPRRFGDYELLEEIARGGMGIVYKAHHSRLNRTVALKVILAGHFASREAVERFQLEARAAAHLDHPGIVPVYEVGEVEGQHFFTMALVGGGSLHQLLAEGPLPPLEAARLVRQVAEAVQYAHDHGILHRDIKPQNILLHRSEGSTGANLNGPGMGTAVTSPSKSGTLTPKLADFGLARTQESALSVTGEVLGTPSYMPPEQAGGDGKRIGPAADVYALGAVLYCLLTGRPPFQSASVMETMRQVREQEPVPLRQLNAQVPADLETMCLKCLEKEPGRRYLSAQTLAEELGRFERGEPVHARPVGRVERSWRWCRRNPVVAGLLVVVAGLLVVVAVVASVGYVQTTWALHRERLARQEGRQNLYVANVRLAQQAWERNQVDHMVQLLEEAKRRQPGDEDLRGFEWHYLWRLAHPEMQTLKGHTDLVWSVAFSPDGLRLAS